MGDPAAMVIPEADFSRTAERSCAEAISCTNAADLIIEKGKIGKSQRPHVASGPVFPIYGVSYAKCALEDCRATMTCQRLLTLFLVEENITNINSYESWRTNFAEIRKYFAALQPTIVPIMPLFGLLRPRLL